MWNDPSRADRGGVVYLDNCTKNFSIHHNVILNVADAPGIVFNLPMSNNLAYNNTHINFCYVKDGCRRCPKTLGSQYENTKCDVSWHHGMQYNNWNQCPPAECNPDDKPTCNDLGVYPCGPCGDLNNSQLGEPQAWIDQFVWNELWIEGPPEDVLIAPNDFNFAPLSAAAVAGGEARDGIGESYRGAYPPGTQSWTAGSSLAPVQDWNRALRIDPRIAHSPVCAERH
jgi:hypothetical protein